MLTTVEGVFRDGKVELIEAAPRTGPTKVLVTFLIGTESTAITSGNLYGALPGDGVTNEEDFRSAEHKPKGEMMTLGMFKDWGPIDEEDFRAAEWHPKPEHLEP
jgi:hypothetical protein